MKTAECEGVEEVGAALGSRFVPASDTGGRGDPGQPQQEGAWWTRRATAIRTVVCGAPNCRPGMLTATCRWRRKMIDGVESDGMLASAPELGINSDHSGHRGAGRPMRDCAPDSIIEVDNKSLTHRPDLWGHHGMAREVAAIHA